MFYQKIQIIIDYINKKESFDKTNDLDVNYLIKLCKNHSLLPILYKACLKYNVTPSLKRSNTNDVLGKIFSSPLIP